MGLSISKGTELWGQNYGEDKMATFTDQELLFLSNLMHMKSEAIYNNGVKVSDSPFENVWTDKMAKNHTTINSILKNIDTDALRNNEYLKDYKFDGEISGSEWADMIDGMKKTDIGELSLQDINMDDKKSLSAYFTDKEGNAYVVFRGTSSGEWKDNFEGAFVTDTEQQQRALDYINSIDADHITVVGHSKGGNKAKYVALLSDKIDRCVAFDGQGFSQLFMEKYQDLIEANKHKITCYALDEDFVNILLYDIYHVKNYIKGNGVSSFEQNHSPNSFFHFSYDADGNVVNYNFVKTEQAEYMVKLHSFINYVAATVPEEDRDSLFSFLGNIVAMAMGKKPPNYTEKYTKEEIIEYLTAEENADELGLLLAYIIEYEEYDDGISEAVFEIMDGLGMQDITKWIRLVEKWVGTENILKFLLKHPDKVIWILKKLDAPDYIITLISNVAIAYEDRKVSEVTAANIVEYDVTANDNIRDYTQKTRDKLLKLTDEVANEKPYDVSKWDVWYRIEDWFGHLSIDNYQNKIDEYYREVIDINGTSNHQMQQIFSNIDSTVFGYKNNIENEIQELKILSNKILNL